MPRLVPTKPTRLPHHFGTASRRVLRLLSAPRMGWVFAQMRLLAPGDAT